MSTTLRIPIARLGKWYHPVYKNRSGEPVVEFTQEDIDSIIHVFECDDRGYEPYLTYGHVKSSFDKFTTDGFPIVGYLKSLEQVDDVLFGDFTPANDKVSQEIIDGNYRYSSGEFVPNAKAKKTDEVFRMFLKGVALTNTPFVPNLPVNEIKASEPVTDFALLSDYLANNLDIANTSDVCYKELDDVGNNVEGPDREMSEELHPENTQPDMVEQIEDVKEIKSMLSDFTTWMKSLFAGKTIVDETTEDEAATEEVDLTEEPVAPVVEEAQVVEEIKEVEEMKPELVADAAVSGTVAPDAEMVAKIAAMEEEKAQLEAAVKELGLKAEALEQEKLAIAQAAAEQQLSDRVADLTNKFGLAPAVADKVKSLASASNNTVISLSDDTQVNLADAVLDLVKDLLDTSNQVELEQVGATGDVTALSDDADNPWADVIKKYKEQSK